MAKLRPNEPCHCGSGKKYKHCHRANDRNEEWFEIPGHPELKVRLDSVEASAIYEQPSSLPEWLLRCSRDAARKASAPRANEYDGLTVLMLVTLAGEAILNRLLEPLAPGEFEKGLERLPTQKKWLKLSEKLRLSPRLDVAKEPLQSFLRTVEARNELVHFKHGRNIKKLRGGDVAASIQGRHVHIDLEKVLGAPSQLISGENVDDKLDPSRAKQYLGSLVELLRVILPSYPDRKIAAGLQKAMDEDLWGVDAQENALREALERVLGLAETEWRSTRSPKSMVEEVAAVALLRMARLLRSILLLLDHAQGFEADSLILDLAEQAMTVSWASQSESHAARFRDDSLEGTREWLDAMSKLDLRWPEEEEKQLDKVLKGSTKARMPSLEERVRESSSEVKEFYEEVYCSISASTHFEYRLSKTLFSGRMAVNRQVSLVFAAASVWLLLTTIKPILGLEGAQGLVEELRAFVRD